MGVIHVKGKTEEKCLTGSGVQIESVDGVDIVTSQVQDDTLFIGTDRRAARVRLVPNRSVKRFGLNITLRPNLPTS